MRIVVCVEGVNTSGSNALIPKLRSIFNGAEFYYHTWSNKTNLIPEEYHPRLSTAHFPRVPYHPLESKIEGKHGKYITYKQKRLHWDYLLFQNTPILQHADLLSKVPIYYDMVIRVDWNTQVDDKVDYHALLHKAYLVGPVGFMTRDNRGPEFGSGQLEEVKKTSSHSDDWYGFLPSAMIFHARKHFNITHVKKLHKDHDLHPSEWGWYQVLSEPYNDTHTSMHGGAIITR